MKKQLHCGYLLSSVKNELSKLEQPIIIDEILRRLSSFIVEFNFEESSIEDSILAVLDNIISRGLPTFPSLFIEDTFSKTLNTSEKKINKIGSIYYESSTFLSQNIALIYQSLFVIEPRFNIRSSSFDFNSWIDNPGSKQEEIFFTSTLPNNFHAAYCQLLESQKRISDFFLFSNGINKQKAINIFSTSGEFREQRVDFCFDLPHTIDHADCLAIEIDGPQHYGESQNKLDQKRDNFLMGLGWAPTVRIKTSQFDTLPSKQIQTIGEFFTHPFAEQALVNFSNPIWEKINGVEALQIALSPFAISRVQKAILFLIKNGVLDLDAEKWHLAVLERDVPCAHLAITDLITQFKNLFDLEGNGRSFPDIHLQVYNTDEFRSSVLNQKNSTYSIIDLKDLDNFDAVIDISMLQRMGFDYPTIEELPAKNNYIKIRSSHSVISDRKIESAKPIKYNFPEDHVPESLDFFLQNLFRKQNFLPGQVKILHRSLSMRSVIALLPTGAGKSLTYQLSALLQPGVVLIVDPLISLMRDQNDNLLRAGIDSTTFINSTITAVERNDRTQKLIDGNYQFVFISPERLQIDEFRQYLLKMKDTCFTYGVVDEAHCVSEWGHDFRTAYLKLGENIYKFCNTYSGEIPIMALTGTASYDVLADVQRELMIVDELSIVSPSTYERKELDFRIFNVIPDDQNNSYSMPTRFNIKENVAKYKIAALTHILNNEIASHNWRTNKSFHSIDEFFSRDEEYPNAGIVFCPHINWVFGVKSVSDRIKENFHFLEDLANVYAGGLSDNGIFNLEQVQSDFKQDKIALLVATKAFGMGIDKPNIRFTIHFNMPQSIESFYQEAGRAGRDKDPAKCYILYSSTRAFEENGANSVDKELMLTFHKNSFKGNEKEQLIISELLDEIAFPSVTLDFLLSDIKNKFDQEISFTLWPNDDPRRLYINGDFPKAYGSIDLRNHKIYPETNSSKIIFPPSESADFIFSIFQEIMNLCPENVPLYNWLTDPGSIGSQPGIERILSSMRLGESKHIAIGFDNDRIQKIEEYLENNGYGFHEGIVRQSSHYCASGHEFIEKLINRLSRKEHKSIRFTEDQENQLKDLFLQTRNDQDTQKAIYRLSVIGIIDDYFVDYNAHNFVAIISKKDDQKYIENLTNHIGMYVSAEEKSRTPEEIMNSEGESTIRKCCNYLIDFVYKKIAKKREEAINVMESAIQDGVKDNKFFSERINSYFDSRYTPELRKYLQEYSIDLVWEYMDKTYNEPDAISHLLGACDRLLVENPQNSAFLLLRSYSKFISQSYDKNEALDDFRKGWQIFKDIEKFSRKVYLENLSMFYEKTIRNDTRLSEYLDPEIFFEHKTWLSNFNSTFLKDYEHAQHQ